MTKDEYFASNEARHAASTYADIPPVLRRELRLVSDPPPSQGWTPQEIWIFQCVQDGRTADFAALGRDDAGSCAQALELDELPQPWSEAPAGLAEVGTPLQIEPLAAGINDVRASFLADVLNAAPWSQAIADKRLAVRGARITGAMNLQGVRVRASLAFDACHFERPLDFADAHFDGVVAFERCQFASEVRFERARVDGSFFLRRCGIGDAAILRGLRVGSQLSVLGSECRAGLNMSRVAVAEDLILREARCAHGDIELGFAEIGGSLGATGVDCAQRLDISGISVTHSILLDDTRVGSDLDARGGRIGGSVRAHGVEVDGDLRLESLRVDLGPFQFVGTNGRGRCDGRMLATAARIGTLFGFLGVRLGVANFDLVEVRGPLLLRGSTFTGPLDARSATVHSHLDLSEGHFSARVDLSGTQCAGDLRLGSDRRGAPSWAPSASLRLRNTRVQALQDRRGEGADAWPAAGHLFMDGFEFERLGGLEGFTDETDMLGRPARWYVDWLRRDPSFSPRSFERLATLFKQAGYPGKADTLLYASRERRRRDAWRRGEWARWLSLSCLRAVIGYGLGLRYFRLLPWVMGLWLAGVWVLHMAALDFLRPIDPWLVSLDQTLPIVSFHSGADGLFFGAEAVAPAWVGIYFVLHKLLAFVLGSLLVAGLAGLTQRS